MRRRGLILALLLAITTAVYWPVVTHEFVNFDDRDYVTMNPQVQAGLSWPNVIWACASGERCNFWHPLTWLSHMLDCEIYGLCPWGHHLTNLLLHLASTCLLFALLNRITRAPFRSALVAGLFALHPLNVES